MSMFGLPYLPAFLAIASLLAAGGLLILTYRRPFLSNSEKWQRGAALITAACTILASAEMIKDSMRLEYFHYEHGAIVHAALVTMMTFFHIIAPFLFGGISAALVVNSLINGKPSVPRIEWKD